MKAAHNSSQLVMQSMLKYLCKQKLSRTQVLGKVTSRGFDELQYESTGKLSSTGLDKYLKFHKLVLIRRKNYLQSRRG